jgi:hypothetical protein
LSKVAFLWDESFLWGLMAYKSLKAINLPFDLVRAEDINKGCLESYRMLFVPGGWASNKLKALGERGIEEIREFVKRGGNYFGICGGAGLATLDGIGLLNIKRKPTKERVPSFSGRIALNILDHPVFTPSPLHPFAPSPVFHAWWPSQFVVLDSNCYFRHQISVIATFGEALPDAFSSDLNVGDVEIGGGSDRWKELEEIYGINLDPRRLINEPAVVEGNYGEGKVILSLVHFDTPDDKNSAHVLKNIWHYLSQQSEINSHKKSLVNSYQSTVNRTDRDNEIHHFSLQPISLSLMREVEELINFGIRNFLWYWRTPMLLQWRRGVRGLEYCTLYVMIKEIVEILNTKKEVQNIDLDLNSIKEQLTSFIEKSKNLLILERYAMHYEHITYEKCFDPKIQQMRLELFGNSKSHGGFFKLLIDKIDAILFRLLDS